mmetsp:Transcript_34462/g.63693  ORF Transcript_34462/g.63693 Transcript_34462/m.63693 type:complete len:101 (-) Transcript_34462:660-962(-)
MGATRKYPKSGARMPHSDSQTLINFAVTSSSPIPNLRQQQISSPFEIEYTENELKRQGNGQDIELGLKSSGKSKPQLEKHRKYDGIKDATNAYPRRIEEN